MCPADACTPAIFICRPADRKGRTKEPEPLDSISFSSFIIFFLWEHFSPPGNISLFKPGFVLLKLYKMCGSSFVLLAGRLFPGPTVPSSNFLWLMSPRGEAALSPSPRNASPRQPSQQKAPEKQMFLSKADGNCRDHFFFPIRFQVQEAAVCQEHRPGF